MSKYDVPMGPNDADADTTYQYLIELGKVTWDEKRPFGNSDWHHELAEAWGRAGLLESFEMVPVGDPEDEYFEVDFDWRELESVWNAAFEELASPSMRADHALDFTVSEELIIRHPPLCVGFECPVSKAMMKSWVAQPKEPGRYPLWVDHATGELKYDEKRVFPLR